MPAIEIQVSLGTPANQPLSAPAEAAREVLRIVVADNITKSAQRDAQ
jgi:LysR family nitrogen assimilation transcriptional regulator